jgi:hypothetical protein
VLSSLVVHKLKRAVEAHVGEKVTRGPFFIPMFLVFPREKMFLALFSHVSSTNRLGPSPSSSSFSIFCPWTTMACFMQP